MIQLLGILGDLLVAGLVIGAGWFVGQQVTGGDPQGGVGEALAGVAFVILFLASGAVAMVRAWGRGIPTFLPRDSGGSTECPSSMRSSRTTG